MKLWALLLLVFGFNAAPAVAVDLSTIPDLYVNSGFSSNGMNRLDLNTLSVTNIVPVALVQLSEGVAVDPSAGYVYWIADAQLFGSNKIRRSKLDGSDPELFYTSFGGYTDLEIDPYSGLMYYAERFTNAVKVIDLNTGVSSQLFTNTEPRGLDIDLVNDHLYLTDAGSNRIRRSSLDGTGLVDLITRADSFPIDVAVNPLLGKMYWVELIADGDPVRGRVFMADLDGGNPTLIHQTDRQTVKIDIDHQTGDIYWGQDNAGLYRASADGTGVEAVTGLDLIGVRNVAFNQYPLIPEPGSLALLGVAGLLASRRRRG